MPSQSTKTREEAHVFTYINSLKDSMVFVNDFWLQISCSRNTCVYWQLQGLVRRTWVLTIPRNDFSFLMVTPPNLKYWKNILLVFYNAVSCSGKKGEKTISVSSVCKLNNTALGYKFYPIPLWRTHSNVNDKSALHLGLNRSVFCFHNVAVHFPAIILPATRVTIMDRKQTPDDTINTTQI